MKWSKKFFKKRICGKRSHLYTIIATIVPSFLEIVPNPHFLRQLSVETNFMWKAFVLHKLNPGQTLGNKRKLIIGFYIFFIITPRSLIYDTSSIKRFLGVPCNPIKLLTIVTFVYTKKWNAEVIWELDIIK